MKKEQSEIEMEVYRKGIEFLYKQTPVIVICFLVCLAMGGVIWVLWKKSEQSYAELKSDYHVLESKFDNAQEDWRMCEQKREEISRQLTALTVRVEFLQSRR